MTGSHAGRSVLVLGMAQNAVQLAREQKQFRPGNWIGEPDRSGAGRPY